MTIRPIIIAPDRRLKIRSVPVDTVDDEIRRLLDDMLESMYADEGIGLAAIQIGVPKRLVVADVHIGDEPPAPIKLVNPEIVCTSDEHELREEGCLSLPEYYADVERPAEAKIRYLDERGAPREIAAKGMLAACLQHEIDHLDGILFVDHISLIKRSIILRKLAKARRAQAAGA